MTTKHQDSEQTNKKVDAGIRLPEPLHFKLSEQAKKLGLSKNSLAILAVDRGLGEVARALTPSYGTPEQ